MARGTLMAMPALMVLTLPAWAQQGPQGPYANVTANAVCQVEDSDVHVAALLEQKTKPGPGTYEVGHVLFYLEQKLPGNPKFERVAGSEVTEDVGDSFPEVAAGEDVEVAMHLYEAVCTSGLIDPAANAIRAVVEVQVLNANPNRPSGLIHTGRCVSVPNPCR